MRLSSLLPLLLSSLPVPGSATQLAGSEFYYLLDCFAVTDVLLPDGTKKAPDWHFSEIAYYNSTPATNGTARPLRTCQWGTERTLKAWEDGPLKCNFTATSQIFSVEIDEDAEEELVGSTVGQANDGKQDFSCVKDGNQTQYRGFNVRCWSRYYCKVAN